MGWKDRYVQGSFRGIPFHIESDDGERSKRIVTHKFPGRDKALLEEMGLNPNSFSIEAILVGDDYLDQRDRLQEACLKAGSGKLIHPFYGEITAKCARIRTRHDKTEMRMVRVAMEFIDDNGIVAAVKKAIDTPKRVELSARQVIANQKTAFEKAFDYASLPYNKAQIVLNMVNKGIEDIQKAREIVGQGAAFAQQLRNIGGAVSNLILNVSELADGIIDLITLGFLTEDQDVDGVPDTKQSFKGMSELFQYTPVIPFESATTNAFQQLVRGVSIAQGSHILSLTDFASVEDAVELKQTLYDAIDVFQRTEELDDTVFISTQDLLAQTERDLAVRTVNLPREVELVLPEFMPALVLAHQLYGNVDQEQDILNRNKISDPGVVPSDIPIKVLTDA